MTNGTGTFYLDMAEFWTFIISKMKEHDGQELSFGVPKFKDGSLVIEFAFDSECNPADRADPPEFLKEWEEEK